MVNGHVLGQDSQWHRIETPRGGLDSDPLDVDGPLTSPRPRRGLKTVGGIAGFALTLSVGAGLVAAIANTDGSDETSHQPTAETSGAGFEGQEHVDGAAERDRQEDDSDAAGEISANGRSVVIDGDTMSYEEAVHYEIGVWSVLADVGLCADYRSNPEATFQAIWPSRWESPEYIEITHDQYRPIFHDAVRTVC